MATRAAEQAVVTNRMVLTRSTGTPELRAAFARRRWRDPVAGTRAEEDPVATVASHEPDDRHRHAATSGIPSSELGNEVVARQPREQVLEGDARKELAHEAAAGASLMLRSWVEPPVTHFSPTSVRPRNMNRNARVTMKEGSRVQMTSWPLSAPRVAAKAIVTRSASGSARPPSTISEPKTRPVKATIEPIEDRTRRRS